MNIMLGFLFLCVVLGLWASPKVKLNWLIPALAVAMVLLFLVSPHRL